MNYLIVKKYEKGEFKKYYEEYKENNRVEILKKDIDIKHDDNIFIAYYEMPDNKNRLFLRASLLKNDKGIIYARSLRGISDYYNNSFSLDVVKLKEGFYSCFPKGWEEVLTKKDGDLSPFDNSNEYYRISNLKDYFYENAKCVLCGEKNFKTFKTVNGMNFVEFHHFIQRKSKENEKLNNIINRDDNLIKLCPTCHSKIHYAEFDTRREAISKIYSNMSKNFKGELEKAINKKDRDVENWIFESYLNDRELNIWNYMNSTK
ncbi:MAG: HNH endonuclease [Bacilli bacterium]|nr:HNH endonuclease [Bacilli bacterium]